MEATLHKMSIDCQIFFSHKEKIHGGPVNRYAAQTGMENMATRISVTAKDTTK